MSAEIWIALEPVFWWLVATGIATLIVLAGKREDDWATHGTSRSR